MSETGHLATVAAAAAAAASVPVESSVLLFVSVFKKFSATATATDPQSHGDLRTALPVSV